MTERLACGDSFSEVVYNSPTLEAILVMATALVVVFIVFPKIVKEL